jgi:hypothetical protein
MDYSIYIKDIREKLSTGNKGDFTLLLESVCNAIAEGLASGEQEDQLLSLKKELEELRHQVISSLPFGSSCNSGFSKVR